MPHRPDTSSAAPSGPFGLPWLSRINALRIDVQREHRTEARSKQTTAASRADTSLSLPHLTLVRNISAIRPSGNLRDRRDEFEAAARECDLLAGMTVRKASAVGSLGQILLLSQRPRP